MSGYPATRPIQQTCLNPRVGAVNGVQSGGEILFKQGQGRIVAVIAEQSQDFIFGIRPAAHGDIFYPPGIRVIAPIFEGVGTVAAGGSLPPGERTSARYARGQPVRKLEEPLLLRKYIPVLSFGADCPPERDGHLG